jgi:hypothetical protein
MIRQDPKRTLQDVVGNCWPNGTEPDWRQFSHIEINAVVCFDPLGPDAQFEAVYPNAQGVYRLDETPTAWSVYGRHRGPEFRGAECLTDCETPELAEAVATLFRALLTP